MKIYSREKWIKLYEEGGVTAIENYENGSVSRPTIIKNLKKMGIYKGRKEQ
ncbi:MAG: hypothetical protein GY679_01190 [Mycoplasma sp.]|nr:hypothetical protein [Mycoplasma sp.]